MKDKRRLPFSSSKHLIAAGFSVWSFEQGAWDLVEDRSSPGFTPGSAPTAPGLFEGYCLKVTSVRKPGSP